MSTDTRDNLIGFTLSALTGALLAFYLLADVHQVDAYILTLLNR